MKPVIVSIAARRELREAQDWYREKGVELAERFEEDFANSAKLVQRNPSLYPVFYKQNRRKLFEDFPYLLVYREEEQAIRIVSIFHGRRNPRWWRARL